MSAKNPHQPLTLYLCNMGGRFIYQQQYFKSPYCINTRPLVVCHSVYFMAFLIC